MGGTSTWRLFVQVAAASLQPMPGSHVIISWLGDLLCERWQLVLTGLCLSFWGARKLDVNLNESLSGSPVETENVVLFF